MQNHDETQSTEPDEDDASGSGPEAVLVVNTKARRGHELYKEAKRALRTAGFRLTSFPVRDPARLPEVVNEAVAKGARLVIVGGGDGTISAVAGCLAGQDVALGLLPMGTANNFARGNDIPVDLVPAVEVIAAGRVRKVDLGRIGDGYFTNAVSLGLSTALHRSGPERMKKRFGRAGYLIAAAQRFAVHKPFRCRLTLDGTYRELQVLDLRIANGPFYGSVRAVERADTHSGKLAVRIVKGTSRWTLGRVWAGMLLGRSTDPASVETVSVRKVAIEAVPPAFVSVDGEVVTQTPVLIEVAPEALNLIVP